MTMQHRAISIGRAYSTLTLFFFFFFYDSLSLYQARLPSFVSSSLSFFFRAYRHRAYQWNFRTAADASGDDINTHIVLFITSGFLLDRNLRCTHDRTDTIFRLMSKNINFKLARDRKKRQMMSFQTSNMIVVKGNNKKEKKKREEDTAGLIGRRISYTCASFVIHFSSSSSFYLIENRQKKNISNTYIHRCLSHPIYQRTMSSFVKLESVHGD
jgi:hypothetical protein